MIPEVCNKYDKLDYWSKCNQLLPNLYPLWSEFTQRVFRQNGLKFISELQHIVRKFIRAE